MKGKTTTLKSVDVIVWTLLTIGGINWGLVGFFGFDAVAAIFGEMGFFARLVYALVGLAALYEIAGAKAISKRWNLHFKTPAHA